jgi:hypothetical protein
MEKKEFTTEHLLYLIAFICALGMRLIGLGEIPLSEFESSWAIQAYQVSLGEALTISGQPAYVLLTGFLFSIFSSSDALARLLPAFMGGMVIWLPYALRNRLGKLASIIFAFGLAFDPGLIATSRVAGGPMLALGFGATTIAAWSLNLPIAVGILGALFLMSGPSFLAGLLGILVTWVIWSSIQKEKLELPIGSLRQAIIAAGATILIAGTLFLQYPQGLSAIITTIPDYFGGWLRVSGAPWVQVAVAFIVYQPLAVLFGIIGMIRFKNWNTPIFRMLGYWFFVSLGLTLAYPSRQVSDLIWVLLPLWGMAGFELVRYFRPTPSESRVVAWGQATLILVFMIFFWLNLASLSALGPVSIPPDWNITELNLLDQNSRIYVLRIIVAFVVPVFAASSIVLVSSGWPMEEAVRGTVWGALIFLSLYLIAASWSAGHIRDRAANELWAPNPTAGYSELLSKTLGDLSEMNTGIRDAMEVVYQIESSSLKWVLRDMSQARFARQLAPGELPPVIINTQVNPDDPLISTAYRGQSFAWWVHRYWNQSLPPEFDLWLLYRDGPTLSEPVILWARTDIFPGDLLVSSPDEESSQTEETELEDLLRDQNSEP